RFLNAEPIQARPAGMAERVWKWARRRPAVAALLAVSAVLLGTYLLGGVYFTVQLGLERNAAIREKEEADKQRARAEDSEAEVKQQKELADRAAADARKLRELAERSEAEARQQLEQARRSLFTAQVWRVAGLVERNPLQALQLLEDIDA